MDDEVRLKAFSSCEVPGNDAFPRIYQDNLICIDSGLRQRAGGLCVKL